MTWKFRKRVKVFSGVYVNFSKTGISFTAGGKGLSVNAGNKGVFLNTNIPGTGIYDRKKIINLNKENMVNNVSSSSIGNFFENLKSEKEKEIISQLEINISQNSNRNPNSIQFNYTKELPNIYEFLKKDAEQSILVKIAEDPFKYFKLLNIFGPYPVYWALKGNCIPELEYFQEKFTTHDFCLYFDDFMLFFGSKVFENFNPLDSKFEFFLNKNNFRIKHHPDLILRCISEIGLEKTSEIINNLAPINYSPRFDLMDFNRVIEIFSNPILKEGLLINEAKLIFKGYSEKLEKLKTKTKITWTFYSTSKNSQREVISCRLFFENDILKNWEDNTKESKGGIYNYYECPTNYSKPLTVPIRIEVTDISIFNDNNSFGRKLYLNNICVCLFAMFVAKKNRENIFQFICDSTQYSIDKFKNTWPFEEITSIISEKEIDKLDACFNWLSIFQDYGYVCFFEDVIDNSVKPAIPVVIKRWGDSATSEVWDNSDTEVANLPVNYIFNLTKDYYLNSIISNTPISNTPDSINSKKSGCFAIIIIFIVFSILLQIII